MADSQCLRSRGVSLGMRHHHPRRLRARVIVKDPVASAQEAGLRYVSVAMPGIRRRRTGRRFSYIAPNGMPIRDARELQRINGLAIPPAWRSVWICPDRNGHIQATGVDAKGRKQYRYHSRWREVRDTTKYDRLIAFGQALPAIRRRVEKDLALSGLPHEKVLATVVRLLDQTALRVGNQEYARENESYGLTTLRNDHAAVAGSTVRFQFRGKGGKEFSVEVHDRRVAKVVKSCQDLPGQELFEYVDSQGDTRHVESADVNEYLRHVSGQEFTAKDFRTWAGTVLTARALWEAGEAGTATEAKKRVAAAISEAAARLGNTQAMCRKCYVHPAIVEAYLNGAPMQTSEDRLSDAPEIPRSGLADDEKEVLALLLRQEQEEQRQARNHAKAS